MQYIDRGVTRHVVLVGPWAIKIARGLRGWMANQSEWRRRRLPGVAAPVLSLLHVVVIYPRADEVGWWDPEDCPFESDGPVPGERGGNEERKGSSWGRFGRQWLLIDFDRAWQRPRSLVGFFYYANQERLGRKWSKLPFRESPSS